MPGMTGRSVRAVRTLPASGSGPDGSGRGDRRAARGRGPRAAWWAAAGAAAAGLALAAGPTASVTATSAASATTGATTVARPAVVGHVAARSMVAPVPTSTCQTLLGIACYSPLQLRSAYDMAPAYRAGYTGAGRTIVIVDSFGSPTVQHDLNVFDRQWGLPHTTVQIVRHGNVPPFDPTNDTEVGWAQETTLDVEYAHAMAPGAHLVLAETAVAETEGVEGLPEMMAVEKKLVDTGRVDVITQSFGATENTFPGVSHGDDSSLTSLRYAFVDAARHGTTVLASSGDSGATDSTWSGKLYPYRVNSWPSSDPLVTSVGGTQLHLDDAGVRTSPDTVWHDAYGAGGGGQSVVFGRPGYQRGVGSVVAGHRGTPDISMSAAVDGGVWVYYSFLGTASPWHIFGGTSESSPVLSGVVAVADQAAARRLGQLDPLLYTLARTPASGARAGIVDVTWGNNSFGGVTGYRARRGYDLASGLGTLDVARFVSAVAPHAHIRP